MAGLVTLRGTHAGANLFLMVCTLWKASTLEQFVKNCIQWEGLMLAKLMEDCLLWERPHAGEGKKCKESSSEDERAAETTCDEVVN